MVGTPVQSAQSFRRVLHFVHASLMSPGSQKFPLRSTSSYLLNPIHMIYNGWNQGKENSSAPLAEFPIEGRELVRHVFQRTAAPEIFGRFRYGPNDADRALIR